MISIDLHLTNSTGFERIKPESINSSISGGNGAEADHMETGSHPNTIATGTFEIPKSLA